MRVNSGRYLVYLPNMLVGDIQASWECNNLYPVKDVKKCLLIIAKAKTGM